MGDSVTLVDPRFQAALRGGFLNIDKPTGWTSTDVVRKLKGLLKVRKIGHGGTLDPVASGVLPICIGQATKFADTILLGDKEYRLTVTLGDETDTYDSEGKVTNQQPFDTVTLGQVTDTLESLVGTLEQVPPMFSAVRHEGRRLYELARKGIEVERKSRAVELHAASVISFDAPNIVIDIRCSHGFYARSLAHELGRMLGTAAHLSGLVRTRSGKFNLADARAISDIESFARAGDWRDLLLPIDFTLDFLPRVDLDPLKAEMVRHGRQLGIAELPSIRDRLDERVRVYEDQELLALLRFEPSRGAWQPEKVLPPA